MKRYLAILIAQYRGLSLAEFAKLAKRSLFCNDSILIYEFDLSQVDRLQSLNSEEIHLRKGTLEDLRQNVSRFKSVPWEFQCHIYDDVKDFYVAVSDAREIQHISWVYYEKDPNRFINLEPRNAEIKYCLTLPEFRGRGIYPQALKFILAQLFKEEIDRVFICVKEDNRASLRGIEKAGFTRAARIRLIKVLGVQLSRRYKPFKRASDHLTPTAP